MYAQRVAAPTECAETLTLSALQIDVTRIANGFAAVPVADDDAPSPAASAPHSPASTAASVSGTARTQQVDSFAHFRAGGDDCRVRSPDLYLPSTGARCRDRGALLDAMSSGGRVGFDAPYQNRGCGT